ncbi:MAG: trigger factor [Synergistaceae bacterium]|jgi:trigger factor|nr:trigger factor [Synergistaceae bacterium]
MKSELVEQERNYVKIKVEFGPDEFAASLDETIQEMSVKLSVPGFRKGRVPRKILEMRLGKDTLYRDVLERILPPAIKQVISDYDLRTIDEPVLSMQNILEGSPLTCELKFEIVPEIVLPELEEIEVKKFRPKLTDEAVTEMVEECRKKYSTLEPVERAVEWGDVVLTDCSTEVLDGGERRSLQETEMDLSDSGIRPEIRDSLLGRSRGDQATVEFDVEPNYQDPNVAGKRVRYDVTIKEIRKRILPNMNPEFYKKVLNADFDSEEAFREEMKKRALSHLDRESASRASEDAVNQILEKTQMEIPETLVNRQAAFIREKDAEKIKGLYDLTMEEFLRETSVSPDEYEKRQLERARDAVRRSLVFDEIGEKFGVTVDKEALDAEIHRMAELHDWDIDRARAFFYKKDQRIMNMVNELYYDKVAALIMEKVKVEEVDAPALEGAVPALEGAVPALEEAGPAQEDEAVS